jgi:hypothetical protein
MVLGAAAEHGVVVFCNTVSCTLWRLKEQWQWWQQEQQQQQFIDRRQLV